jgi:2-haloacid dehalogenase
MPKIEAVVFDAYGTLFDVHSVIRRGEELFPGKGDALSRLWRTKQLEYTWLRSLMGRYEDFEQVTRAALKFTCKSLGLACTEITESLLMQEYLRLSPYPDARLALDLLKGRKLAILSNGSPAMLDAVVSNAGLGTVFHSVLSVHTLRIFKPHPSVYQWGVEALGIPKAHVAFVSSNFWDICGATAFGFRTFWINRSGAPPDELGYSPAAVLARLDELGPVLA